MIIPELEPSIVPVRTRIGAIYLIFVGLLGFLWPCLDPRPDIAFESTATRLGVQTRQVIFNAAFLAAGVGLLRRKRWAPDIAVIVLLFSTFYAGRDFASGLTSGRPTVFAYAISFALVSFWNGLWLWLILSTSTASLLRRMRATLLGIAAVTLLVLGLFMVLYPDLLQGYTPTGGYLVLKQFFVAVWGTWCGLIMEVIGANTLYYLFKQRSRTSERDETSGSPSLLGPSVPDPAARPPKSTSEAYSIETADPFIARIPEFAELHVASSRKNFGITLDYSDASLIKLDEIISKHWAEPPVLLTEVAITFGSYVGETVRRQLGGSWVSEADRYALTNIAGTNTRIYPYEKVRKRFIGGSEESIADYYKIVRDLVDERKYGKSNSDAAVVD